MARTRNLDPGRADALHYASTSITRHAKPLVYACFAIVVGLGTEGAVRASQGRGLESQGAPCVTCQALSLEPGQVLALPPALNGTRVLIRVPPGAPAAAWTAGVADVRGRGGRAGLHFTDTPPPGDPAFDAEVDTFVFETRTTDVERGAFEIKQALAAVRGRAPNAGLFVAADDITIAALRERGVAAYATGFLPLPRPIEHGADLLAPATGQLTVRTLPADAVSVTDVIGAAAALQAWLPEGLVSLRERALSCGGDRRIPTFLNPRTLDLVGVTASCPAPAEVTSDMPGAAVERYDLAPASVFLVHGSSADRFAAGVDVAAARTLTAEEVVARHQAAAARQSASIETDIASGTSTLTFEAPSFVAPVTVVAETTIYRGARREVRAAPAEGRGATGETRAAMAGPGGWDTEVQQGNIRVNGVRFESKGGVPHLPIIEPERAAAPPLSITLSDLYRYRLAGRETVRGRECYVVAFAPRQGGESLFEGRAWIDAASFAMARVSASQTSLKGPIVASEQTDDFEPDAGGRWLLTRSDVRQAYEGASVRTPIHRLLILERHEVNAPDFASRLAAAHASSDVMLRETPAGFRYLAKDGGRGAEVGGERSQDGPRLLAGRAERIRTFAFGVIVDPNISIPLPFAGLSYVDFNLFGTGTQFSGFYGGSYGQLAFSAPSVRGTRWQLAGRAFGIASSYNDRAFEHGLERYDRGIRQRPAQVAVWTLRPLSARTALRLEYDWDYNHYARAGETAPSFEIPHSQNAHAIRIGLDAQRAGWQASAWGSFARRIGWAEWGVAGEESDSASHAQYQRFGASLLRSAAISPSVTARIEGAVMGGRDLDRFSRYTFGTFDNRLHGYPSALVRYDKGGVLRTAAAWSLGAIRLDGFGDAAVVHDPGFGPGLRHYLGAGAALEAPGPFRTLLSAEWGYGFQGIGTNGRTGTQVFRLSGYKVF